MRRILDGLFSLQDLEYMKFVSKLIPTIDPDSIIGVRSPALKAYFKRIKAIDCKDEFIKSLPHKFYEENNLHASYIGEIRDIDEVLAQLEVFLPYVDNWATCDTLPPKIFKKHPQKVFDKVDIWLQSEHIYTVRFAIVTLLNFYLDEHFNPDMLYRLAKIQTNEYYINMAIAWYYSYALIKQYDTTIKLFEEKSLSKWIHNKSIQKAVESFRISPENKQYLRNLRIK
ncbi:MAG: DNA alkylation repair protein [Clostridiales bacterium]|nr:DNA alkylation repair protein [Clostridiales bacterium]